MKKSTIALFSAIALLGAIITPNAGAHCQVPCGIFSDQIEFEKMLEAHTTIAKANTQIAELVAKSDALSANQLTRWIVTKEDHAKKIMASVAEYFMAQRIKADAENYEAKLVAAHKVMTSAMKAKQDPSAEVAEALKASILDLYRAYEGKEPDFHSHE